MMVSYGDNTSQIDLPVLWRIGHSDVGAIGLGVSWTKAAAASGTIGPAL